MNREPPKYGRMKKEERFSEEIKNSGKAFQRKEVGTFISRAARGCQKKKRQKEKKIDLRAHPKQKEYPRTGKSVSPREEKQSKKSTGG